MGWPTGFYFLVELPKQAQSPGGSGASLGPALSGFSLHDRVPPCPMSQLFQGQQGPATAVASGQGWQCPGPQVPLGEDGLTFVKEVTVVC